MEDKKQAEQNQKIKKIVKKTTTKPEIPISDLYEKISEVQKKCLRHLDDLWDVVLDGPDVEDEIDLRKKKQRSTEFTSRFARNYLYQIGRIVSFYQTIFEFQNSSIEI